MTDQLFSRTGVRFEVAIDVIGAIVAHYTEVIALERDKSSPDLNAIELAEKEKALLRDMRDELDPNDRDRIESIIEQLGPRARALYVN